MHPRCTLVWEKSSLAGPKEQLQLQLHSDRYPEQRLLFLACLPHSSIRTGQWLYSMNLGAPRPQHKAPGSPCTDKLRRPRRPTCTLAASALAGSHFSFYPVSPSRLLCFSLPCIFPFPENLVQIQGIEAGRVGVFDDCHPPLLVHLSYLCLPEAREKARSVCSFLYSVPQALDLQRSRKPRLRAFLSAGSRARKDGLPPTSEASAESQ